MNTNYDVSQNDNFTEKLLGLVFVGLAIYGGYTVYKNITKSPEQRLLEALGRELHDLDLGYADNAREIPYEGGHDEE